MALYPMTEMMEARITNDFTYHKPKNEQAERYESMREKARHLAFIICENTPPSREQSLALSRLEEAIFWANAAIARNE
jgi:hypothetical protein